MSTDFSIRPVGAPAVTPVVQPSGDAAHKAVATELNLVPEVLATRRDLEQLADGRRDGALCGAAETGRLAEQPVERHRGERQPDHAANDDG